MDKQPDQWERRRLDFLRLAIELLRTRPDGACAVHAAHQLVIDVRHVLETALGSTAHDR
jgi:hypothetical protein